MARLPHPGGDKGNWGDILNDYLSQSHADDGTLKPNTVSGAQIKDASITNAKLAKLSQPNGIAALDSDGDPVTTTGKKSLTADSLDIATAALIQDSTSSTKNALSAAIDAATATQSMSGIPGLVFQGRIPVGATDASRIPDLSGFGKDAVVRAGSLVPTLTTLGGSLAANFATGATLQNVTFASWPQDAITQPIQVWLVANFASSGPSEAQRLALTTTGTAFGVGPNQRPSMNAGSAVEFGGPPMNDDTWHVFAFQMLLGSGTALVDGRVVGLFTTQAHGAGSMTAGIGLGSTVGAPTNPMVGQIAEVIISHSASVSLELLGTVSAQLATRWGLSPGLPQTSVTYVDVTLSTGQLCRIFTHAAMPATAPLVIVNHQQGGSYAFTPSTAQYPIIHELVNAGFVVAIPNNHGADSWTNDAALGDLTATHAYVAANVAAVTGTVLLGLSMGGGLSAIAATTAAGVLPDLRGVYLIDAAVNLGWAYDNAYSTSINTAFGITTKAQIPIGKDPVTLAASAYRTGLHWRAISSPNDVTISKANSTDMLAPIIAATSPAEWTSLVHNATHLHRFGAWPRDVVDFCLRATA